MNKVQKNFLYNVAYQILLVVLPLVTAPYIARVLGPEAVGIYSYTNSVAYYFLLAATLGIAVHGNRSVAKVRDDKNTLNQTFSGIFALQAITFAVGLAAYAVYAIWFAEDNKTIVLLQMIYVLSGLLDISWLFFGLEEFKITVTRNILIKLATVAFIFMCVHNPGDLWIYTLIMGLGTLLSQAYLWLRLKQHVSIVKVKWNEIVFHLKPALVLFLPVLAYSVYKVMDKIMLGNMSTYEQVGFYNSAEKIINIPMGIITALGTVMLPKMTNSLAKGDTDAVHRGVLLSTKFVTILASAIAFGLIGISACLTPVFFGEGYEPCVGIICLLALTVFFVSWSNVIRTQYLIPKQRDSIYVFSTLMGAVLNLVANLLLIPHFHAAGAAVGTIIAEASVMLIQAIAVRKEIPTFRNIWQYVPVLLTGIAMAVGVWHIGDILGKSIYTLVVQIACGGVLFCGTTAFILAIKRDELWQRLCIMVAPKRNQNKQQ